MCGICGYTGEPLPGLMDTMIEGIRSRGPDDEGQTRHPGVHLGHTRLAVIDPEHGAQPLSSADGRYVVTYNGEIYNYAELRAELEARGVRLRTHCDTELIPAGFAEWGEDFFTKLDGMFAFALLDTRTGVLRLVRDPLGIKPLYYAISGGTLVFASAVRSVLAHPAVGSSLSETGLRDFIQSRWLRSATTMYESVHVLPAATLLVFDNGEARSRTYWRPGEASVSPTRNIDELVEAVGAHMADTVRRQLRADAPVSVFLSGGVDSSYIARLAAGHGDGPISAFTIDVGAAEDVDGARELAAELGMDHRVSRLEPEDFDMLPAVIGAMDRPVGDAVVLATWKLCRAAAEEAKVALSGDGADELFGGYVHMPVLRRLDRLRPVSPFLRMMAPVLGMMPVAMLDRLFHYEASLGRMGRQAAADLLAAAGDSGAMLARATQIVGDGDVSRATHLAPPPPPPPADLSLNGLRDDMIHGWLPEQILPKMDQLSMAHGLEVRVPYVTIGLLDLLAGVDERVLLRNGDNKYLLRAAAEKVGLSAARRKKRAFHVPTENRWRDPLQRLTRSWLSDSEIRRHGVFKADYVADISRQVDAGEFLASKISLNMAALHMWLDANAAA